MGTWMLGKQGSRTGERVPEAEAGEQRNGSGIFFFFFWRVLFGSLKGTGTPILGKQDSRTGERVPEAGVGE